MNDVLYKSIDKNMIKEPVAYCRCHKAYLSKKQMKIHRCISRGCTGLQETNDEFWEERRRRKKEAKLRKKELYKTRSEKK
jgi:hypothetical protein